MRLILSLQIIGLNTQLYSFF